MKIKLDRKLGKSKMKLFALCNFNISKMTWLFIGIFLAEQGISVSIEMLLVGDISHHWFDSVFLIALSGLYFHYSNALGEFLLDLHLNAEVTE